MVSQELFPVTFLGYLASIWVINYLAGIVISVKILGLKFLLYIADINGFVFMISSRKS
jgi:hypothetical protein